jgi:glycosyltransferase involved in cell wall biosynthesis
MSERFSILPPVSHRELRAIYERASVFVLPCLIADDGDRDGIPNVLAEAMAMELPVVATTVSGIPEIVADGQNGLLVAEREPAALAVAIGAILADPARAALLGRSARATILRQFDAAQTHVQLKNLFDQSLAGNAQPQAMRSELPAAGAVIA